MRGNSESDAPDQAPENNDEEVGEIAHDDEIAPDWTWTVTSEPIADAIAYFLFEEGWRKQPHASTSPRPDTMAAEIKERQGGPDGAPRTVWSWNSKNGGGPAEGRESLNEFLADYLDTYPDPARYVWIVSRSALPNLREFDSSVSMQVVNTAWVAGHAHKPTPQESVETGMVPGGVRGYPGIQGQHGLPLTIYSGPSPIGVNPAAPTPAPAPSGVGGDIGGTGMSNLVNAMASAFERIMGVCERSLLFTADLNARNAQHMAAIVLRHPDADAERARLDHEYRMRLVEGDQETELQKHQETSGMVRDLGGKVLDNEGLTAVFMALAKKWGLDPEILLRGDGK